MATKTKSSSQGKGQRLNLVTGACGFVGSHLVERLLADGQRVIATDLPTAFEHPKIKMIAKNIGLDLSHPKCKVMPSDLTKIKSMEDIFKQPITHIYHTASLYDYAAPMDILRKVNIDGSINFFNLALNKKTLKRFIHWSTCGIFGHPYTSKKGKKCNIPFSEELNSSPKNTPFGQNEPDGTYLTNDYCITKWEQEQIAWKYYRDKGLPLTVVRPAPLYGPGSDYGLGGIILLMNKGFPPVLPTDGKHYITASIHVTDMVGFSMYIADKDFALGEDYNVVDDGVISYYEFLHYIALLLGRKLRDVYLSRLNHMRPILSGISKFWLMLERKFNFPRPRIADPGSINYMGSSYWISNKKSKDAGYTYRYSDVREGLRHTIEWFRKVGWLSKKYKPYGAWKEYMES